jgi:hypothetical protein
VFNFTITLQGGTSMLQRLSVVALFVLCAAGLSAQGYSVSYGDISGGFQSISRNMSTPTFSGSLEISDAVRLPRTFTYFGEDYDTLQICVHGFVRLGDRSSFDSYRPDHDRGGGQIIAAHWWQKRVYVRDDLGYATVGDELVIEWNDITTANPTQQTVVVNTTMQIRLNTATGVIEFHYTDSSSASPFFDTEDHAVAISDHMPQGRLTIVNGELIDGATTYVDSRNGRMGARWPTDKFIRFTPIVPAGDIEVSEGGSPITHQDSAAGTNRDFGSMEVNTGPSSAVTIRVSNSGAHDLDVSDVTLTGTDAGEFILTPANPSAVITPGNYYEFDVAFDPSSVGNMQAMVEITHNDTTQPSPFTFEVVGESTATPAPIIEVSEGGTPIAHQDPAAGTGRDFGSIQVNSGPSGAVSIRVTNSGNADLDVSGVTLTGSDAAEFLLTPANPNAIISPGNYFEFDVSFDPSNVGNMQATVEITHDDTAQSSPFTFEVVGESTAVPAPSIAISEGGAPIAHQANAAGTNREFPDTPAGSGQTASITVTIANTGNADLDVTSIDLTGANASEFILAGSGGIVSPQSDITFTLAFNPQTSGSKEAWVEITHNDASESSPFEFQITGVATAPLTPVLSVRENDASGSVISNGASASGIRDFVQVATVDLPVSITIWVENAGTADLTLGTPSSDDAAFTVGSLPGTLSPGNGTSLIVTLEPVSVGSYSATISFSHDDSSTATPFTFDVQAEVISSSSTGGGGSNGDGGGCAAGTGTSTLWWLLFALVAAPAILRRRTARA